MLNISGNSVKVWVNEHDSSKGKWKSYAISVGKKDESGSWLYKPVKLYIKKDIEVPAGLKSGDLIDFEGFPTLDVYTGRDGQEHREIMIVAQKINFKRYDDSFAEAEVDIPF